MKKFVLLAAIAFGAWAWSTEAGNELVARLYAMVTGRAAIEIDFDSLTPEVAEDEIKTLYSSSKFKCYDERSELGDRVCFTDVREVNGVPARYAAFFFKDAELSNVKVALDGKDHPTLVQTFTDTYGEWRTVGSRKDVYGKPIVGWYLSSGVLAVSETAPRDKEATLLWISRHRLLPG
ncbi:hypothetical protein SVA_1446 [Sulfurifustis variabilis]|uniref:Uncharacterized protein n=1 Tax=Sulfurifustis variabilis TaxID=1675686 RepID=A0A1B4VBI1_9GAMM|nr:hypothetical protein [Sulfurifustis variabilis]BAU48011.1 hypothetical protein SVA_1446 [Sulfurifustis variabilis]